MTEAERLTGLRDRFAGSGDRSMVAEIDDYMQRRGLAVVVAAPLTERVTPQLETRKKGPSNGHG